MKWILLIVLFVGCAPAEAPKTSNFEHDHEVADHWPQDLADVAVKLRRRTAMETVTAKTRGEIDDLVSWTAEVAADTNLSEENWLPIYNATESLSANLRRTKDGLSDQNRRELESLCDLIDQASQNIPDQLPYLSKDQ